MEFVFVVPRRELFPERYPQGFVPFGEALSAEHALSLERWEAAIDRHGFFVERARAEREPEWKQVIPYSVIVVDGDVLLFQRTQRGGEERLHGKLSIGIGGHINPDPDQARRPSAVAFFEQALLRELFEELHLEPEDASPRLLGILNDDSTAVGRVHLGLVYGLDLPSPGPGRQNPRVREISKMQGGFRRLRELQSHVQNPGRFESWSTILLEAGVAGPMATSDKQRGFRSRPRSGIEDSNNG